ncbi:MAG: polysaccharide biosynthesis tyrosine autokinase [Solirubrobacteraceae bacterium]
MPLPHLLQLVLARQRRVFLTVFPVAMVAAAAITFALPKQYRAEATLFVGENRPVTTGASAVQLDEVLARTYVSLLATPDVQKAVVRALPFPLDPAQLDAKVSIEVATGTQLIRIAAVDADRERARRLADVYATTFVDQQRQSSATLNESQLEALRLRIGGLAQEVSRLGGSQAPAGIARRAVDETELQAARDAYAATQQSLALQGSNVSLASHATRPTDPSKPRPKLYLVLGFVVALALGAAAAALVDRFDDRLRGEEDLGSLVPMPLLARVPVAAAGLEPAPQEAFDLLCANLRAGDSAGERRVIAVTSALPGEGKSFVVGELATAFARLGTSVLAVDCDLRRPTLGLQLGGRPAKGVTNLLVEARRDPQELVVAAAGGVHLLASGPLPPSPAALLGMARLRELFGGFRERYDHVVVDSAPVTAGADTTALATAVDGVVLVVDLARGRRRALAEALAQLERAETEIVGVVLNRVRGSDHGYMPYGSAPASTPPPANGSGSRSAVRLGEPRA